MGQRAVSDGEIIRLAWEAEDRVRCGARCLAHRRLSRARELSLLRLVLNRRRVFVLVVRDRAGDDVFDFADGDAAWRSAIGWDGKGEPEGFARYRRRA
jgi:hypothetical protein